MKKVYPSAFKRFYALIIDIIITIFLSLFLDQLCVSPIYKNATDFNVKQNQYYELVKEYDDIQDKYNIYIYDEDDNRILNKNLTKEQEDAFFADTRGIEIREQAPKIQDYLVQQQLIMMGISFITSVFIYFVFLSYVIKGRSIGKFINHIHIEKEDNKPFKYRDGIIRGLLNFLICVVLGICSVGVVPAIVIINYFGDEKKRTVVDKILKLDLVVDEKYQVKEN